jgi:molybdopterin molybdotransferase
MLSAKQASERIRSAVGNMPGDSVAIGEADGRVLARDVIATRTLPPWDNSAMDGFAVRAGDVPGTLPIAGVVAAGAAPTATNVAPRTAVRIMTGAPMPAGADAVVMREQADDRGDAVAIEISARPGDNVRRAGEDVAAGDVVLPAGTRLGPGEIGLCAALGMAAVDVAARPRVGILSTGDELVDVGVDPAPGQIVNSNAYALAAQVREAGGVAVLLGIAPDDRDALTEHLRRGLDGTDVLCTSGGVSVGDYDFVKPCFEALGVDIEFWKVAIKPGKPLAFGVAPSGALVFGLPGNPVSSMVVFELFVRPALLKLQGARNIERPRTEVTLATDYRKQAGRAHYVRATLDRGGGTWTATPISRQGSGMLRSMVGVDALVEVAAELTDVAAGTRLSALLLGPR